MKCQKCGSGDMHTRWHKDGHACSHEQRRVEGTDCCEVEEHLHETCRNCGFTWRSELRWAVDVSLEGA